MITIHLKSIIAFVTGLLFGAVMYEVCQDVAPDMAMADRFSAQIPGPGAPPANGTVQAIQVPLPGMQRSAWIVRNYQSATVLVYDPKEGPRRVECYQRSGKLYTRSELCSGWTITRLDPLPERRASISLKVDGAWMHNVPNEVPISGKVEMRLIAQGCTRDGCTRWEFRLPAQSPAAT